MPVPDFAPLIDVTDLPIADIVSQGHPRLAQSAERVARDLDDPDGVIAAFSSYAAGRE